MAENTRPLDASEAPDTARSYERAKPENESGMGRLDNNDNAVPTNDPDRQDQAVKNRHQPHQINAEDVVNQRGAEPPEGADHSMFDEEPRGEDLMPTDIHDPQQKRHPRKEGKGGTP